MEKIRTLFISDVHLGNPNSQAEKLLKIFKMYDFEKLIILGDFIDMTYMKRKFYWNQTHSTIIQKVLKYSRNGTEVIYLIGNHDYYIRTVIEEGNILFGNILICDEFTHQTLKGKNIYLTHGDCFDGFIRIARWVYWLGDISYELSISINKIYNWFRRIFKLEYWSLSAYLKKQVKTAVKFITEYQKMSEITLREKGCDAIMIGHTHNPEILDEIYYNTGDWVESCSYIIEDIEGNLKLLFYK